MNINSQQSLSRMSVGVFSHSLLGTVKKYILNNDKNVIEVGFAQQKSQVWYKKYKQIKDLWINSNKILFYLTPIDVYLSLDRQGQAQQTSKQIQRIVIYDHFVVTLKDQIQYRKTKNQHFSLSQLWFFLFAICRGSLQLIQLQKRFGKNSDLDINPQTILLNQFGYIKMIGYCSSPLDIKRLPAYQAPQYNNKNIDNKQQICASFSIGRVMSSLILLQDLTIYIDKSKKTLEQGELRKNLAKQKAQRNLGMMSNLVIGLLQQNSKSRLKINQIFSLMTPFQSPMLMLRDFQLDKGVCRQNLIQTYDKNEKVEES